MSDAAATATATVRPRFEVRPSALGPNAPDEFVDNEAKPLTFGDMLDAINPLQQLPVIGSLYRAATGTTIAPAARIVGGVLFGGLAGGISAVANALVESVTGKDLSEQLVAMVAPGKDAPAAPPGASGADMPAFAGTGESETATLQFAAYAPADPAATAPRGRLERGGLLTTWIPDAAPAATPEPTRAPDRDMRLAAVPPGALSLAGLSRAPAPAAAPPDQPAKTDEPAPALVASAPEMPAPAPATAAPEPRAMPAAAPAPADSSGGSMRAMPLDAYRARAIGTPVLAAQMPAIEDRLGLLRRAEAVRAQASQQQAAALVPAALQAQQASEDSPQSYFAASMERGLERYRQMQRQREEAARGPSGI
jgi:hypothetical protein